jgi:LEA14-like dessication related protein
MSRLAAPATITTIRPMKHLLTPLLLLILTVGGLTGCSSMTKTIASGLRIEVTQVQRDSGGNVLVSWRVQNPNVVAYLFTKSSHKLTLDGTTVGSFEETVRFGVPAFSHAERTATLVTTKTPAPQIIEQALARGSTAYGLDSTLWVLIVDEQVERISLKGSGQAPVSTK